jgi:uncharacterized protein (TIGR02271 family)
MYNSPADKNTEQDPNDGQFDKLKIPVFEERLSVDKNNSETGKVTITKHVHSEQQIVNIPVVEEEVNVERIPINQYIESTPPAVRYEGEKTIIPILKEVLVVEKKLVLVEEVHITRKQIHSSFSKQETLRQEEIIVNRVDSNPSAI